MKKTLWIVLSLFIGMMLISGCSFGGTGASGNKSVQTAAGNEQANVLEKIKQRDKIIAGVKFDQYLFGLKNPATNAVEGFDIDLMKSFAKYLLGSEDKVEFKEANSKSRIELLRKGEIDLIASIMTITEQRKKQVDFSNPYFKSGQTLVVPVDSTIKGIADLDQEGKTITTAKGTTIGPVVKAKAPHASLKEYENFSEAFTALKSGKGDAFLAVNGVDLGLIKQSEVDGKPVFKMVGEPLTEELAGYGVNKGNEALLQVINEWLAAIKADGTYDQIYEKWFGNQKF
jgi:putative glutamine transport system substrate-binding protein